MFNGFLSNFCEIQSHSVGKILKYLFVKLNFVWLSGS